MLIRFIIAFWIGLFIFFTIERITSTAKYGGVKTKDAQRSQLINQKAIVSSWLLLLMFFIINFVFDFFNLNNGRLTMVQFKYSGLFYLLLALVSYFIYYCAYSRQKSSNEK